MGLKARIWASRLGFVLETGIWASRLEFGPQDWNLGNKTGIWASRLGFGPRDWDLDGGTAKKMKEEKKKKEKIPHMCESIGHQPLWGRCPKTIVIFLFLDLTS